MGRLSSAEIMPIKATAKQDMLEMNDTLIRLDVLHKFWRSKGWRFRAGISLAACLAVDAQPHSKLKPIAEMIIATICALRTNKHI